MKESFGDSSRWLPLTIAAVLLVLVGFGSVTALNAHQRSVDAQQRSERLTAAQVKADWNASMKSAVAKKKAQDRQDARLAAAQKKAEARYKAQERAAAKAAARHKAAAREKAKQVAAAKAAQVAQAKAAKVAKAKAVAQKAAAAQAAAQKVAKKKAEAAKAALVKAAQEAAASAVQTEATTTLPLTRTISGQVTEPDILNALMPRVHAYPGEPTDELSMTQLTKLQRLLTAVHHGKTYRCPLGSGGEYKDIHAGAPLYVEDRSRTAVATGRLTGGTLDRNGCTFDFTVPVPDLPFYRINVTQRGQLVYSHEDMVRHGWKVWLKAS